METKNRNDFSTSRAFLAHNHTEYSNLHVIDSINRSADMIDYAWKLGLGGLAFTDHDCLSGSLEFLDNYEKKLKTEWKNKYNNEDYPSVEEMSKDLDFKVALGNEIYLSEEGTDETAYRERGGHFYHYLLIAKDLEGFRQLRNISSNAWKRGWWRAVMRTPTWPSDLFNNIKGGHVICATACLAGYVARMAADIMKQEEGSDIQKELFQKVCNHMQMMEELFGKGNYFLEIQPSEKSDQIDYNKWLIKNFWGQYPFIFTTDSHYLNKDYREIHKAFLNSRSSGERDVDEFYGYAYMMSADEVYNFVKDYVTPEMFQEMIDNTRKIKDMCHAYTLEQPKVIAKVPYEHEQEYEEDLEIFNDVDKETYPYFYDYIHGKDRADHYLAELIAHGFIKKYKDTWNTDVYYKRLEEELWTIKEVGKAIKQDMADYFIAMAKMIDLMWGAGSLVGPARGSAGTMLINYLIGITQMDPIVMNLPYVWRFMHPSRPDLPDIDVDTESDKRAAVFNNVRDYFRSIGGDVVNVCTFGTEGTKSAIKTAARGLHIDDDTVSYLTSMIPNERGFDWSLHDCYYGNDGDRKPISAFKQQMDQYPELWSVSQAIEGLVTRLGVHASGVVCLNNDLTNYAAFMKTNKEQIVTCYDLHTLERCGLVKYDFLTVSALDRIHQCMNYMLEDGTMQWQGSLKETYDKYINPQIIDYDNKEMWDMAADGKISSLFQFDTSQGRIAMEKIRPHSLAQLAISNSIMRLMSDEELPLEKYAKFKTAPQLWYNEMDEAKLTREEQKLLEKYLSVGSGIADSQEVVMELVMDPHISNFDMKEANRLRKTIAKKNFKDIAAVHELFLKKGQEAGSSLNLLNYVWDKQISLSLGYSFSRIHTTAYSIIAVQEMNLAYFYPIIYWNCACLSVDSSAINASDFYNLLDENIVSADEVDGKKQQNKMDYSKLASALNKFRKICTIKLPDINKSRLGFTPDAKNNTILYGLKGISRITQPVIDEIMANRPFTSLQDFLNRVTKRIVTKDKIVNLIKCGAFDEIEGKDRDMIMEEFIMTTADQKKRLTMQNANMLIDMNLLPPSLEYESDVYKMTKELRRNRDATKNWYLADRLNIPSDKLNSWRQITKDSKVKTAIVKIDGEDRKALSSASWDAFYEMKMNKIKSYIKGNSDTLLNELNSALFQQEYDKYASGNKLQWELDSLNFFFDGHPLAGLENEFYPLEINRLDEIVEGAEDGQFKIKNKLIPKMKLYTIIGTVIDKEKVKGIVTLQTPDGVVNVKIYKDLFALYNQTLSSVNGDDKTIIQDSFFEKGTNLIVTGVQRGVVFIPKVYKNTGRKPIMKINLDANGHFLGYETKKEQQNAAAN